MMVNWLSKNRKRQRGGENLKLKWASLDGYKRFLGSSDCNQVGFKRMGYTLAANISVTIRL